ncbi:MAG: hypothetical protein E6J58_15305 [Deltaproteobacteria bacterium]|nr:MAG: hypothetical protein E6J67_01990 [Deltaproteobacteria bacterium]TMB35916.1 MAG: hypothetical protein E6J58_15305 [Deltaproteobacteria bacterium]
MDRKELIAEIKLLNRLLDEAHNRAVAQFALIDKLTAASLHVQGLLKKLALEGSGAAKRRRNKG